MPPELRFVAFYPPSKGEPQGLEMSRGRRFRMGADDPVPQAICFAFPSLLVARRHTPRQLRHCRGISGLARLQHSTLR